MGDRQLNVALHRIAITQAQFHPEARDYLQRRRQAGDTTTESIRVLKRWLSDVVHQALRRDAHSAEEPLAVDVAQGLYTIPGWGLAGASSCDTVTMV
jgi:hypothetical protein